jgi:hypothetical protein
MHATPLATPGLTKTLFAMVFGVALWGWVLGLTGAALRFLANYSPTRRYIADASYWIYLMHLPVVAAFQVWVGHWPLHWGVKYPFILLSSFAILFVSYHYLVRPTFIGQLLNGRKHPRKRATTDVPPSPTSSPTSPSAVEQGQGGVVARLRGITKRYGAVTALANIDIEVRSGELLAVLGPNGAGKSTAISLWLGLTEADEGEVTLFGGSPQELAQRRHLGVMMQDVELPKELRARELVALARVLLRESAQRGRDHQPRGNHADRRPPLRKAFGWPEAPRSSSPSRSAAGRKCCSSMNPPSASTSRRAKRSGQASARCSPKAAPSCSPLTTSKRQRRSRTAWPW